MIRNQTEFEDVGESGWEEQRRERTLRSLKRRAKVLGFRLVAKSDMVGAT